MIAGDIAGNLAAVRERIHAAERAAGRPEGSVALLPVSKFHPVEAIVAVRELGITMVGENREQEARDKAQALTERGVDCGIAMIGQIQSKKANAVARWAAEVHSLDSVKLANGLDRGMALALERGDRPEASSSLPCLIQLSADGDTSRGGIAEPDLPELIDSVEAAQHLEFAGFMVVPPLDAEPRAVFEHVRTLTDDYSQRLSRPLTFSAGMSGDFEDAIACGSDIVRVGTAVFGPRPVI
ncbi:YggS family pyridoxal phosphate-dependent enzyme [Corynebacterium sp. CNCTC7651]|uniref:YggS family pyridoxal phosphate-dependent enzyme n=1 Tax=Corynebacterium sp. CNCTC7651 TaxID=2815361 RepID=UPI001F1CDEB6|nr:YggS family pyridoxal phosphate-dependent enzyme [Corynebacterium sp. CNCTC7651]UIZ91571.1 YggS family pyridoxal phosphate-dependent enzyme [Corynebacterium sp. CNCTC7651]